MATEKNNLEEGIVNLVDKSGLVQIELDTIASITCVELDFTDWLWRGVVVKEKEFRTAIKALDTEIYGGVGVGITCSEDAIVPDWAWMLISSRLNNAEFVVIGGITAARAEATRLAIVNLNLDDYIDKRVVIKGCSNSGGADYLVQIQQKLQPVVKSLMFGEACSTVPVYKKPAVKR
jgi:hypothetical protein